MVNAFTASTVMQSFTKKYRFQTRSYESDGVGGFVSSWTDGPEFGAVERHDTTVEAQVAEQAAAGQHRCASGFPGLHQAGKRRADFSGDERSR